MVLIAIQDGSVNGVKLQKRYNLHVLTGLSIGGIVNAMLVPVTFYSLILEKGVYYNRR